MRSLPWLGAALAVVVVLLDWLYFGNSPLREDGADLSTSGAVRSLAYAASMACVALGIRAGPALSLASFRSCWFPAAAFLSAALLWRSPGWFHYLSLEDGPVEYLSALSFLGAAGFAASAARFLRGGACLGTALFGFVSFLIAGEELSWGERVFYIIPPAMFDANLQGELNFHNFHTGLVEALFYFLAGPVFFTAIPAAAHLPILGHLWRFPVATAFRPGAVMIPFGAAIAAMNWDMWNAPLTQIGFWGSLCILVAVAWSAASPERLHLLIAAALCLAAQLVFLAAGGLQIRAWDITEYKELAIGAAFCVHAFTLRSTAKRTNPPLAGIHVSI